MVMAPNMPLTPDESKLFRDMLVAIGEVKMTVGHVLEEARKTNGRVTRHDDEINALKRFDSNLLTVATTASAIGGGAFAVFKVLQWTLR